MLLCILSSVRYVVRCLDDHHSKVYLERYLRYHVTVLQRLTALVKCTHILLCRVHCIEALHLRHGTAGGLSTRLWGDTRNWLASPDNFSVRLICEPNDVHLAQLARWPTNPCCGYYVPFEDHVGNDGKEPN